jgi:hypothetical protein
LHCPSIHNTSYAHIQNPNLWFSSKCKLRPNESQALQSAQGLAIALYCFPCLIKPHPHLCPNPYPNTAFRRGDRVERARLYKATNEACFGVQIATNAIHEGVAAAKLAAEAGASWIDLNCGCPIYGETLGTSVMPCDMNH